MVYKQQQFKPMFECLPKMKTLMFELAQRMGYSDEITNRRTYYLDTETTGLVIGKASIWQIAALRTEGAEIVETFNKIISISREAFEDCPKDVRERIHLTWDTITEKGEPEEQVFRELLIFLNKHPKLPVLGHNMRSFDNGHILSALAKYPQIAADGLIYDADRVIDTGIMVKAARMERVFYPNETPAEFMNGVSGARIRGLRWSLDWLVDQLNIDTEGLATHDALVDCTVLTKLVNMCMDLSSQEIKQIYDISQWY